MNFSSLLNRPVTRREALRRVGGGFGMVGLALQAATTNVPASPWSVKPPHFAPKAKHVIFLFLNGGLSHIDSFDYKPLLDQYDGKPLPYETPRTEFATGALMRSPFQFQQYGQNGTWVSELFPKMASIIDEFCIIRSMRSDIPNHGPGMLMMNTGFSRVGRPSMGSWITYGLGLENQNLPGYVVLCPSQPITIGSPLWSAGFLPAMHQGTYVKNEWIEGEPFEAAKVIPNVTNSGVAEAVQRRNVDFLRKLNEINMEAIGQKDSQLDASIKSMETAYRMQTEAPNVFDVSKESKATLDMYGPGSTALGSLMAVRLAEKGVRMVQVYYSKGDPWDAHTDILSYRKLAKDSDQPFAAVVKDLKQRGLLDETLVICGTEFGRTPAIQTSNETVGGGVVNGRDHNPGGFSVWLAGGGVKRGITYGATDDFGYTAVEKKMHVHDLHATILYLLGIDHTKLTYRYSGRDFKLTDTAGNIVHDIVA